MRWLFPLAMLVLVPQVLSGQGTPLTIRLAHDSDAERRTRDQLLRLVERFEVNRWIETREILIDETTTPHSHPVLTLHTRHLDNDLQLMSTFVHEQFHWYLIRERERRDAAMAEFREHYPDVPVGGSTGARDTNSTYLHLVVCDLEFQAMTILVGREEAARTLQLYTHYEWIYDRVVEDPFVRSVLTRHKLILR
jgi:hypothetical protein